MEVSLRDGGVQGHTLYVDITLGPDTLPWHKLNLLAAVLNINLNCSGGDSRDVVST